MSHNLQEIKMLFKWFWYWQLVGSVTSSGKRSTFTSWRFNDWWIRLWSVTTDIDVKPNPLHNLSLKAISYAKRCINNTILKLRIAFSRNAIRKNESVIRICGQKKSLSKIKYFENFTRLPVYIFNGEVNFIKWTPFSPVR